MSRPNFRVVEGSSIRVDMKSLKNDYLNPLMSVDDICKKHSISRNYYLKLRKTIVEETGVGRKPIAVEDVRFNKNKNIAQNPLSGKFRITYFTDGKPFFFGNYDSFEIAEEVRDLLIEHDWNVDYYNEVIRPKYNPSLDMTTPFGFEDDFLDPDVSVDDLRKKYSLTQYQYRIISSTIKQKHGLSRKPRRW